MKRNQDKISLWKRKPKPLSMGELLARHVPKQYVTVSPEILKQMEDEKARNDAANYYNQAMVNQSRFFGIRWPF